MKKTALEKLNKKSENAVNLVFSTIEKLKYTNEKIVDEYNKNNEILKSIQNTQTSLNNLKASNEKIIANFKALLN